MELVNLKTGITEYKEKGGQGYVGGPEFRNYMKNHKNESYAFVHSHPLSGGFSINDLETLLSDKNTVNMFIATQIDGKKYIIEKLKTPDTMNFDQLFEKELSEINRLSRYNKITPAERTKYRERIIINNLIKKYTKGLIILQ